MRPANILVTGGAGFIGSHTCELLLSQGRRVRILDNLEPPTHTGKPELPTGAEFQRGDLRNVDDLQHALRHMDAIVHLGGTGGYTADLARYVDVNALGTARLLEASGGQRIQRIVVASSVGIYGEGAYRCSRCGPQPAARRSVAALERGEWEPPCPVCGTPLTSVPTPETKLPEPAHPYSVSVFARERLVLASGIPSVALRFFLTYGPRQSLTNPYTGTVSLFSGRLLNGQAPIVYEDGRQTRDLVYVEDVARAIALALDKVPAGQAYNVGSGTATSIGDLARRLGRVYRSELQPECPGYFRPGEARHVVADASRLRALGWEPQVDLQTGLERYAEWLAGAGDVLDTLGAAFGELQRSRVVRRAARVEQPSREGLSVIVPAYNEAGNLESVLRALLSELPQAVGEFEVIVVDDGSRDGTGPLAERLAAEDERVRVVRHPFNVGFGGAQKSGFRAARLDWVVVVPADHQFDVRDLRLFWDRRRDADLIASRRLERMDPLMRRLISRAYNRAMRVLLRIPLRDTNWVKMWRRELFDAIDVELRGFGVDAEIVAKARALGYRIAEIEVPHYPRTWGTTSSVRLSTIYRTARQLVRIPAMLRRIECEHGRAGASPSPRLGPDSGSPSSPHR